MSKKKQNGTQNNFFLRKILPWIIGIVLITAIGLFLFLDKKPPVPVIYFDNLEESIQSKIMNYLQQNEEDIFVISETAPTPDSPADIIVTTNWESLKNNSRLFATLSENTTGLMPSSMRALGMVEGRRIAYPLQLDHVEMALNKALLAENGIDINDTLPSLDQMEDLLSFLGAEKSLPLMVSGKNDQDFMDFISVFVLSLSQKEGLEGLNYLINADTPFEEILSSILSSGQSFEDILLKIASWRQKKILHPEWLNFTRKDVSTFLERDLASGAIMRLSEHRTYSNQLIDQYQALPFPQNFPKGIAVDILCPSLFIATYQGNNLSEERITTIEGMIEEDFQKTITFTTGMAPVNSTSETMDIQAADVRFHAAASNRIAPQGITINAPAKETAFIDSVRAYLFSH